MQETLKAQVGDKIILVNPDETSQYNGVQKGQIGKVTTSCVVGCFATNPSWKGGRCGFINNEFEVLKDVESKDEG